VDRDALKKLRNLIIQLIIVDSRKGFASPDGIAIAREKKWATD
jgi:hypothetical protein